MNRSAGVLLSVTSLPSKYGIGCFSDEARLFVDWLAGAGQTYWQLLPLGPTSFGKSDDSPYQAYSAFAGNHYFIDLDALIEEGVLSKEECEDAGFDSKDGNVDYEKLHDKRLPLLRKAYERSRINENPEFQGFVRENQWWLSDYALFMSLKLFFNEVPWTEWPEDIRMRWSNALDYYNRELYFDIEFHKYLQFCFWKQWKALKEYANQKGIRFIGDLPIYVSMDSADVWAHPELFQLGSDKIPVAVAGCPPDSFSATGQIWGNPLYNWGAHQGTDFEWWTSRMWYSFQLYDMVRIDHFRGFDEYYSIPSGSESALDGHWEKGPGIAFFRRLEERLGRHPIIAEDLGYVTDTVRALVRDTGFPNMKVLQFGFDPEDVGAANDHLPHNYHRNCVAYTGTHDNETILGWYRGLPKDMRQLVRDYMCDTSTAVKDLNFPMIALAMRTCADTCIIPMQDYLGLDNSTRMNTPSTVGQNWRWRLKGGELTEKLQNGMLKMARRYGRYNWGLDK